MIDPTTNAKMRRMGVLLSWLTATALIGTLFTVGPYLLFFAPSLVPALSLGDLTKWIIVWSNLSFPFGMLTLVTEAFAVVVFVAGLYIWRNEVRSNRRWQLCARGIVFTGLMLFMFYYFFLSRIVVVPAK